MKSLLMRSILLSLIAMSAYSQEPEILPEADGAPEPRRDNVEGDLNSVNSNNGNINNSRTYQGMGSNGMPVNTAVAPSLLSSGVQSCLRSTSNGVQGFSFGISRGAYEQDPLCNLRANSLVLNQLGLKISAVSLMCSDPAVYKALLISGSPCPLVERGKIVVGRRAYLKLKENPELYVTGYAEDKEWYDAILGVGEEDDEDVLQDTGGSLSDRFRASSGE